jgi:hypothetical protein
MQTNKRIQKLGDWLGNGLMGSHLALGMALLFSLGACFMAPEAHAVHPLVMLEDSYELKLADTRWPEDMRGAVLLPGCLRCKQDRYRLGATARFLVGSQPTDYREFLAAVRSGKVSAVFIFIDKTSGELSRATVMP